MVSHDHFDRHHYRTLAVDDSETQPLEDNLDDGTGAVTNT